MPVREAMKTGVRKVSFACLSPLAKGRIIGMREAGGYREEGHRQTRKEKMASLLPWWLWTNVLERFNDQPDWDGLEKREAGGDGTMARGSKAKH